MYSVLSICCHCHNIGLSHSVFRKISTKSMLFSRLFWICLCEHIYTKIIIVAPNVLRLMLNKVYYIPDTNLTFTEMYSVFFDEIWIDECEWKICRKETMKLAHDYGRVWYVLRRIEETLMKWIENSTNNKWVENFDLLNLYQNPSTIYNFPWMNNICACRFAHRCIYVCIEFKCI